MRLKCFDKYLNVFSLYSLVAFFWTRVSFYTFFIHITGIGIFFKEMNYFILFLQIYKTMIFIDPHLTK